MRRLWLLLLVFLRLSLQAAEKEMLLAYRPEGVRPNLRTCNYLSYYFAPHADGLPATVYRGVKNSYHPDHLLFAPPYGDTLESRQPDQKYENPADAIRLIDMYRQDEFVRHQRADDARYEENVVNCSALPSNTSDLLYGYFRLQQVYGTRSHGYSIPRATVCADEDGRHPVASIKHLFFLGQRETGNEFLEALKLIAAGYDPNSTNTIDPRVSFDRPMHDGLVHPVLASATYGMDNDAFSNNAYMATEYSGQSNGRVYKRFKDYLPRVYIWTYEVHTGAKTRLRPLPWVYNVDFLGGAQYDLYGPRLREIADKAKNAPPGPINGDGFLVSMNWDKWSCCSACCCKEDECGNFYVSNCGELESFRSRRGLLTVKMTAPNTKFWKEVEARLSDLFAVEPYKTDGLPITSIVWQSFPTAYGKIRALIDQKKVEGTSLQIYWKQYTDVADCMDHPQKLDCREFDACHGTLRESEAESYQESDPCDGIDLRSVLVKGGKKDVEIEEGHAYRLGIDFEAYKQEPSIVTWTTSGHELEELNDDDACDEITALSRHVNKQDMIIPPLVHIKQCIHVLGSWNGNKEQLQIMICLKKEKNEPKSLAYQLSMIATILTGYIAAIAILCCCVSYQRKLYARAQSESN
ncbi:unnamed protein product, partial [Mesorhabditis spiculigera]